MSELFTVFGAGQIGNLVTRLLLAEGHRVRQVRRSGGDSKRGEHEIVTGDLTDLTFAARAAEGSRALIHCAVPPYHQWTELLERLNSGVLHAAKTSRAPLVVLDNLYGYGKPTGPLSETSAVNPCSRKGELRAKVAQQLTDAHASGNANVTIARASDFYGPDVLLAATFGERFLGRLKKGKAGECFGDPTVLHSYSYAPDVAAGLVTLAHASPGGVWHLPTANAETTAEVVAKFGRAMKLPRELKTSTVPGAVMHVMGWFVPAVKELLEMRYQWQVPFVLDDAKFRVRFQAKPTSLDDGISATVEWLSSARMP